MSGQLTLRFSDHDEVYRAGDAFYPPPGHVPVATAGTEVVDFSPIALLQETMAVVGANMAAAAGAR